MPPSTMKTIAYSTVSSKVSNGLFQEKFLWWALEVILLFGLGTGCAFAQGAAEYGSATSGIAGSISRIKPMNKVDFPSTSKDKPTVIMNKTSGQKGSKFIEDSMIDGSVEANRQALEAHAGKDAAKLMLRSVPDRAYVRIDGKIVGRTPLLLIIPPRKYDVAMDGTRMEHAERSVDLLPRETRKYTLTLKPRYPTEVKVQLH